MPIPFGCVLAAYSDHFPFLLQGVPTALLSGMSTTPPGRGHGHTAADTAEKVSLLDLREAAALLARVILRLAGDDEFPLKHRSRDEVRALLDKEELLDVLKIEGANPFEDEPAGG